MLRELADTDIPHGGLGQADGVVYSSLPTMKLFQSFFFFLSDIFLHFIRYTVNPVLFLHSISFERSLSCHALVIHCRNYCAAKSTSDIIQLQ